MKNHTLCWPRIGLTSTPLLRLLNYQNTCICAVFLAVGISATTQAQISIGPRAGWNLSYGAFDIEPQYGTAPETNVKFGLQAGVVADVPVYKDVLSVQVASLYTNKGYDLNYEPFLREAFVPFEVTDYFGTATFNYNYVEFPLLAVVKAKGFQLSVGPYYALALGGNFRPNFSFRLEGERFDSDAIFLRSTYDLKPVSGTVDDGEYAAYLSDPTLVQIFRSVDYGLKVGLGYRHKDLLLRLEYSHGYSNLTPDYDAPFWGLTSDLTDGSVQQNRVIEYTATWFFTTGKKE